MDLAVLHDMPLNGVDVIKSNDLAIETGLLNSRPLPYLLVSNSGKDRLAAEDPTAFPVCVTTWGMARKS